jgi:hypothetical protein
MRDRREPIGDIVAAGEHGENTRRRKGCCFVDGSNVCMSMGRAHNYGVRQSGQLHIVGEAALAGQETEILLAPHRLTDAVRHGARRVHALYSAEKLGRAALSDNAYPSAAPAIVRTFCLTEPSSEQMRTARPHHHRWSFEGKFD